MVDTTSAVAARPLLVFDGDCAFCSSAVEQLRDRVQVRRRLPAVAAPRPRRPRTERGCLPAGRAVAPGRRARRRAEAVPSAISCAERPAMVDPRSRRWTARCARGRRARLSRDRRQPAPAARWHARAASCRRARRRSPDPCGLTPPTTAPPLRGPVLSTQGWRDVAFLHWVVATGRRTTPAPRRDRARHGGRAHVRRPRRFRDAPCRRGTWSGDPLARELPRDQRPAVLARPPGPAGRRVPEPGRRAARVLPRSPVRVPRARIPGPGCASRPRGAARRGAHGAAGPTEASPVV